jgi:hypothetical protein
MSTTSSLAARQAADLSQCLREHRNGYYPERVRTIIHGVTDRGTFVDGMTADACLARAADILVESRRVYRFGNSTVYEVPDHDDPRLDCLAIRGKADPNAAPVLANLIAVSSERKVGMAQSLPPSRLVAAIMADERLWGRLPVIQHHSRRPCFDKDFQLCQPGWNPGSNILVHSPRLDPVIWSPDLAAGQRASDRLPPRLRELLGEFNWRSDADLANAVAMLLTGLLINHFGDQPHPMAIIDANQSGVGKTILVQSFGRVLDGCEAERIPIVDDQELEKKLGALLRCSRSSLFFFDNVRASIESALIEQNVLSPILSFRLLGHSSTINRPNAYLWFITSNQTSGTPDLIRRSVPIRLLCEADLDRRAFRSDPIELTTKHRDEILGELIGMVLRWVEQGRNLGHQRHRCRHWAATIGGILDANGLGEFFLTNLAGAAEEMDEDLRDFTILAELVVQRKVPDLWISAGVDASLAGKPASGWSRVFDEVLRDRFGGFDGRSRDSKIGSFFASKVGRSITINLTDGTWRATLRRRDGSARAKFYFFEVASAEAPRPSPTLSAVEPVLNAATEPLDPVTIHDTGPPPTVPDDPASEWL